METYAIVSTLLLGILIGFFGLAGVLYLLIQRDEKKKSSSGGVESLAKSTGAMRVGPNPFDAQI